MKKPTALSGTLSANVRRHCGTDDNRMCVDTVIFKKGYEPLGAGYWRDVGFTPAKNGRLVRNADAACMTVYPNGHHRKDWLTAQASIPKIVFGHNATLPTEEQARDAASRLCDYVAAETGLLFAADDVKLFRIDFTRDYDIREGRAHAIALELLATDLRYFQRASRYGDSVLFQREQGGEVVKQLAIYPKFVWAADTHQPSDVVDASRGKLRLEVRLLRKGLTGIQGAIKPLDYLSQSISDSLLNEAEATLDLRRIIDARNIDFQEMLIVHARGQQSFTKYGLPTFVELVKRHGEKFHLNPEFHYPKSTYYKRKREVEDLGFWHDLVAASQVQTPYV